MQIHAKLIAGSIAAIVAVVALWVQADDGGDGGEERFLSIGGVRLGEVWPGPEQKLYSQGNEELIIRDILQDKKNGIFLDVGCSTPIANNTTYYLEKHLGWSGISIDALPEHAPAYKEERPNSKFFSYIVTDHSESTEEFFRVTAVTGLSSTDKDRSMIKNLKKEKLLLPTITLNDLLERNGVTAIDFMSLDIEGGAPKALAGFDIDKYQPKLVCIEAPGLEEFIEKYFTDHDYARIDKYRKYDHVNWYYVPARDVPASEPN